jgi:hypothetical protein
LKNDDIEIVMSVAPPPPPPPQPTTTTTTIQLETTIISVQPATPLTESRRRSSRLLGLKPSTPFNAGIANTITNIDSNLPRSARKTAASQRRSDLIKWDDTPSQQHHTTVKQQLDVMHEANESSNAESSTSAAAPPNPKFDWLLNSSPSFFNLTKSAKKTTKPSSSFAAAASASASSHVVENKENVSIVDDVDDFLSFDDAAPIKIKRESIAIAHAKMATTTREYLTPNFTRKSLSTSNSNRVSLSANTNVINSPLLKIALISSHGKRLSTNMNSN